MKPAVLLFFVTLAQAELLPEQTTFQQLIRPNTLVLTYDDIPELAGYDISIGKSLAEFRLPDGTNLPIHATFYANGCRIFNSQDPNRTVSRYTTNCYSFGYSGIPESRLDELAALGDEAGNHSYDHLAFSDPRLSREDRVLQLTDNQALLNRHFQFLFKTIRAPNLDWTPEVAAELNADPRIRALNLIGPIGADYIGTGNITYNGKTITVRGDWECLEYFSPEACAQLYIDAIRTNPKHRGIILIHGRQPYIGASDKPLRLTQRILSQLPPGEYRYITMSQLLKEIAADTTAIAMELAPSF